MQLHHRAFVSCVWIQLTKEGQGKIDAHIQKILRISQYFQIQVKLKFFSESIPPLCFSTSQKAFWLIGKLSKHMLGLKP
jgi:hypothetical protein